MRILPLAAMIALSAPLSTLLVRRIGSKLPAAAGLLLIAGGLFWVSLVTDATTTYSQVLPGMLLIGAGAGLLMPTATDAVVGSVPRGHAAVGSATNGVAIQVGGAFGVGVIGSVLATRYEHLMSAALATAPLPSAARQAALGSIGGALQVAAKLPGLYGAALAARAGPAFQSGSSIAAAVGAAVALAGALVALVALPSRPPSPRR